MSTVSYREHRNYNCYSVERFASYSSYVLPFLQKKITTYDLLGKPPLNLQESTVEGANGPISAVLVDSVLFINTHNSYTVDRCFLSYFCRHFASKKLLLVNIDLAFATISCVPISLRTPGDWQCRRHNNSKSNCCWCCCCSSSAMCW